MRRLAKNYLVYLILLFIASLLISFPLLIDKSILKSNDMPGNLANFIYTKKSILEHGVLPEWNPYLNYGIPIVADPLYSFYNPVILVIFFLLPLDEALKSLYLMVIFLSGVSFFILLKILKINGQIALLFSITYMSSGYLAARIYAGHLEKIVSYPIIPLLLISLIFLIRNGGIKWAGITGICLTLFVFSGAIYSTLYSAILLFTLTSFQLIILQRSNSYKNRSIFASILSVPIFFLLFSAVKIVPLIEIQPYIDHIRTPLLGSQNFVSIMHNIFLSDSEIFNQAIFSEFIKSPYFWWENHAYIGLTPLIGLLLFPKVLKTKPHKEVFLFVVFLVIIILFSMIDSPLNPFFWIFTNISFLQQFRIPSRIFVFAVPIILLLSAITYDFLYRNYGRTVKMGVLLVILINACIVVLNFQDKINRNSFIYSPPIQDFSTLLDKLKKRDGDQYYIGQSAHFNERAPVERSILNELRLKHNYGFKLRKSYSLYPESSYGIYPKYFIFPKGGSPSNLYSFNKIYTGYLGSNIYLNDSFTPYADIYQGVPERLKYVKKSDDSIRKISIKPNVIEVIVNSNEPNQTLLLLESNSPGWNAFIDNRKTTILKSDYLNIKLENGYHTYTFIYRSPTLRLGLTISVLSFIAWTLLVKRDLVKRLCQKYMRKLRRHIRKTS